MFQFQMQLISYKLYNIFYILHELKKIIILLSILIFKVKREYHIPDYIHDFEISKLYILFTFIIEFVRQLKQVKEIFLYKPYHIQR